MSTEDQNRSKGQEYIDNKNNQVEEGGAIRPP